MIGRTAKRFLDFSQAFQKLQRIAFVTEFQDRIQKFSRARFATNRIGLVNRRGKNWRLHTGEIGNCLSRATQIGEAITKIRSKRDGSSHQSSASVFACVPW